MEAMDAQCAAFLVYNVSKAELVLLASTGVAALEPYAASLDARSFVAAVAKHDEPTSVHDAHSTSLEVPESLRHGTQAGGSPPPSGSAQSPPAGGEIVYPLIPNRWLVVRTYQNPSGKPNDPSDRITKSWVLESDDLPPIWNKPEL